MRVLKVWGGLTFIDGKQKRTIVATQTKKKAIEILKISSYYFNSHWGETSNEKELRAAKEKPEIVFVTDNLYTDVNFYPLGGGPGNQREVFIHWNC